MQRIKKKFFTMCTIARIRNAIKRKEERNKNKRRVTRNDHEIVTMHSLKLYRPEWMKFP